jgi:hypothetical protein
MAGRIGTVTAVCTIEGLVIFLLCHEIIVLFIDMCVSDVHLDASIDTTGGALAGGIVGAFARRGILDKLSEDATRKLRYDYDGGADGADGDGVEVNTDADDFPEAVTDAVALLLTRPEYKSMNWLDLRLFASECKLPVDQWDMFGMLVFSEVVWSYVQLDADFSDLTALLAYAKAADLEALEMGNGLILTAIRVAEQLAKDTRGFFTADFDDAVLEQATRIFFLAEKLVGGCTTGYSGTRT